MDTIVIVWFGVGGWHRDKWEYKLQKFFSNWKRTLKREKEVIGPWYSGGLQVQVILFSAVWKERGSLERGNRQSWKDSKNKAIHREKAGDKNWETKEKVGEIEWEGECYERDERGTRKKTFEFWKLLVIASIHPHTSTSFKLSYLSCMNWSCG